MTPRTLLCKSRPKILVNRSMESVFRSNCESFSAIFIAFKIMQQLSLSLSLQSLIILDSLGYVNIRSAKLGQ